MSQAYRNHPVTDHMSVIDADTQLVDVRQPDEVASGTLSGSVNIPLEQLAARLNELEADKRTVLLCRSGTRSALAADFLTGVGFVDVVNLEGGMIDYNQGEAS